MTALVDSAVLDGIQATPVQVQVSVAPGLPSLTVIGMADASVHEARERVRAALRMSGVLLPPSRITVNLAPAAVKKSGASLDLPIAIGILLALGYLKESFVANRLFVGELSLTGEIGPCRGSLQFARLAVKSGRQYVQSEKLLSSLYDANQALCLPTLGDALRGSIEHVETQQSRQFEVRHEIDYAEVVGQELAIKAASYSVAGGHHLLFVGPPGCGKTLVAQRIETVLPPLRKDELLDVAEIANISGDCNHANLARPFRSPHHSSTTAGMVGGGSPAKVGEITLAHRGFLFLDEILEFKPSVLQQLRQPLESGRITHVRAQSMLSLPAKFTLVATANPCPCGYAGDDDHPCQCSDSKVRTYRGRIGGPLIDRFDMIIHMKRPKFLSDQKSPLTSRELAKQIASAIEFRRARVETIPLNTHVSPINRIGLTDDAKTMLFAYAQAQKLSARRLIRTALLARTIADMSLNDRVERNHIATAAGMHNEW